MRFPSARVSALNGAGLLSSSRGAHTMFTFDEPFSLRVSKSLLQQVVHVLEGGEEHTQVVRRRDQLAEHVDGLIARVKEQVCGPPFALLEYSCC